MSSTNPAARASLAQRTTDGAARETTRHSDHIVVDLANAALCACGYNQFRQLEVHCENGRVTLQGRLPTYYLKQVAQVAVQSITGVRDVDNDIKVDTCK